MSTSIYLIPHLIGAFAFVFYGLAGIAGTRKEAQPSKRRYAQTTPSMQTPSLLR